MEVHINVTREEGGIRSLRFLIFDTLEQTLNFILMPLEETNEKYLTSNGQKLKNGVLNGQKFLKKLDLVGTKLKKMRPKSIRLPSPITRNL